MKNPYFFDQIRVDLRDVRGRLASISKAKYVYVYLGKKFLGKFQFDKVREKSSIKLGLIRSLVNVLEKRHGKNYFSRQLD